jgi:transcriptional regulator with XRE-family HTH domain
MADVRLSARAKRIVLAGKTMAGPRWQSALSRASGISQSYLAMIASGERPVTDDVERKVAAALLAEADKGRKSADKLDEIAGKILQSMEA